MGRVFAPIMVSTPSAELGIGLYFQRPNSGPVPPAATLVSPRSKRRSPFVVRRITSMPPPTKIDVSARRF